MTRSVLSASALLLLWFSVPAASAPTGTMPAADRDRLAAAEKLLDAMNYDRQIDRTIDAVVVEVDRSIDTKLNASLTEPLPPNILLKIKSIVETHMRATLTDHRAEMRQGTALIYAKHFSVAELKRLAELQSDPVMVKMQQELPQIAADTMALTEAMVAGQEEQVRDEVKTVVEDYLGNKGEKPSS